MKRFLHNFQLIPTLSLLALLSLTVACSDDDSTPAPLPGEKGFFIVNEGAFGNGDASISFFDKETKKMTNDVYFNATNEALGDQAQSMTVYDTIGFILVQNSRKIEVFDIKNNESIQTIDNEDGIVSPRYLVVASNGKAYISDWGADGKTGTVKVLNLSTYEITKTIPTGQGTNRMIIKNNKLYATNAGGWGFDNTVAIIDITTDAKVGSIEVGDNPNGLAVDSDGNIWVSASGKTVYNSDWSVDLDNSTTGSITKINSADEATFKFEMPKAASSATGIQSNQAGNEMFFKYDDGIYSFETEGADSSIKVGSVVAIKCYGFGIDPSTDNLIICQAPDFSSAGTMYRYTSTGTLIDEYTVGIGPNGPTF